MNSYLGNVSVAPAAERVGTVRRESSFTRSVLQVMERAEYRRCEKGEDLEAIYRLRYRSYRLHGFVPEMANRMVRDELDDVPNSYKFGVFIDDQLVSTVRLHHLSLACMEAPVMTVFDDVLRPRLLRGETFINPSQLAADPEWTSVYRSLPYVTLRLAVLANAYFRSTSCVCMIRDEHTAFYRRVFGAVQITPSRIYPPISVPLMLYDSDCATNLESTIRRFPFFRSTEFERRMLFQRPGEGDLAPLTVLPTAKYLQDAA